MIDDLYQQYQADRNLLIKTVLRRKPEYFTLEPYLRQATLKAIDAASSGIKIRPAAVLGGYESEEARAIRMLRQDVARMERVWGLIGTPESASIASQLEHQRQERIAAWRKMLADTTREVRERGADRKDVLLGNSSYLSLEQHLDYTIQRLVRAGTKNHGRTLVLLSGDEENMSYQDRVLLHLNSEISRIEHQWEL